MSLFIGNIANVVPKKELEEQFSKYGKCEINFKGAYAFAEFSNEKEAENAKNELHNKEIAGRKINIEWSKKSKNYQGKRHSDTCPKIKCYICGRNGHFARDCYKRRRRSNSRHRYHNIRYRSRSRHHHHRRKHSYSSDSRSPRKRSNRRHRKRSSSRNSSYSRRSRSRNRRDYSSKSKNESREEKSLSNSYRNEDNKKDDYWDDDNIS